MPTEMSNGRSCKLELTAPGRNGTRPLGRAGPVADDAEGRETKQRAISPQYHQYSGDKAFRSRAYISNRTPAATHVNVVLYSCTHHRAGQAAGKAGLQQEDEERRYLKRQARKLGVNLDIQWPFLPHLHYHSTGSA